MEKYGRQRKEDWKRKKGLFQATEQEILKSVLVDLFLAHPRRQSHSVQSRREKSDGNSPL